MDARGEKLFFLQQNETVQGAFDDADDWVDDDDDKVDGDVVNLVCESLNLLCDMGDTVAGLSDVLLKLPKSLNMSMRRSLL